MHTIRNRNTEAVEAIAPVIAHTTRDHEAGQKLWFPSELIPEDHTFPTLPAEIVGPLVLNALTEDGLPYFTANLVKHLGSAGPIVDWTQLWTAEEDRHGTVIQHYLTGCLSRQQLLALESMRYQYLRVGFWPDWSLDPFQLFAYVVIQEQATQISHGGIARLAKDHDPVLQKMLARIAGEENKHHKAYLRFFTALTEIDASKSLTALATVIKHFQMPGQGVQNFKELSVLQEKMQIFGPAELAKILEHVWKRLNIGSLSQLNEHGERARNDISRTQRTLLRVAERSRKQKRTLRFSLLGEETTLAL